MINYVYQLTSPRIFRIKYEDMDLKNKTTFNKLYQAACNLADRLRRGEWTNSDRSIEECEAAIKSLAAFIDDGKADCTGKRYACNGCFDISLNLQHLLWV